MNHISLRTADGAATIYVALGAIKGFVPRLKALDLSTLRIKLPTFQVTTASVDRYLVYISQTPLLSDQ